MVHGEVDSASAAASLTVGSEGSANGGDSIQLSPDAGIAPRVCEELFAQAKGHAATVSASFFEIYCEDVIDLLANVRRTKDKTLVSSERRRRVSRAASWTTGGRPVTPHRKSLQLSGGRGETVTVQDATTLNIDSAEEALQLLRLGMEARVTASTRCNTVSSRGHAIMVLSVTVARSSKRLHGQFYLCDLAGSEKVGRGPAYQPRVAILPVHTNTPPCAILDLTSTTLWPGLPALSLRASSPHRTSR